MKKLMIATLAALLLVSCSQTNEKADKADVPDHETSSITEVGHYDFKLVISPDTNQIEVNVTLSCQEIGSKELLLNESAEISSAKILNHSGNSRAIEFIRHHDTLVVSSPDSNKIVDAEALKLKYRMNLDYNKLGDLILRREDRWYPVIFGMPFTYEMEISCSPLSTVILPDGLHQSDNGVTQRGRINSLMDQPIVTLPLLVLGTEPRTSLVDSAGSVQIHAFCQTDDSLTMRKVLNQASSAIEYYSDSFGSFRYNQLVALVVPDFKAVQALPGILLIGDIFVKYFDYPGFGDWPAHEVAHEWIGHDIFTSCLDNPAGCMAIEEGLTEYLRIEWVRNKYGSDSAKRVLESYWQFADSLTAENENLSILEVDRTSPQAVQYLYKRAPLVWDKVRNELGPDSWDGLLQDMMQQYAGRFMSFSDIIRLLQLHSEPQLSRDEIIRLFDS